MKKYFVIAFVLIIFVYIINYGFTFSIPPCAVTEEEKIISSELQGVTLVVEKDTPILVGDDGEGLSCTKTLSTIERRIGMSKYSASRLEDERGTAKGLHLTLKRIIRTDVRGIGSIEGSIPIDYLIVEDENKIQYRMAMVWLGSDSNESFIGVYKDNQRKGSLVWQGYTGGLSVI
jgi:hypothetical protein